MHPEGEQTSVSQSRVEMRGEQMVGMMRVKQQRNTSSYISGGGSHTVMSDSLTPWTEAC